MIMAALKQSHVIHTNRKRPFSKKTQGREPKVETLTTNAPQKTELSTMSRMMLDGESMSSKLAEYVGSLSREDFNILVSYLSVNGMKDAMATLSTYPFIERKPGLTSKDDELIDLKDFGEVLCHYIYHDGGPGAFSNTQNHRYILLLYSAYYPSFTVRINAVEKFLMGYIKDLLDFKDVILHTPYPETAEHILNRLISTRLVTPKGTSYDSSLMAWHNDCVKYRGDNDPVTKVLESKLEELNMEDTQSSSNVEPWGSPVPTYIN
jgi:hypothetical protein